MEKIVGSHSEYLKPAKLYLGELKDIYGIFRETCKRTSLTSEGYHLSNLDEIPEMKKDVLREFELVGHEPYISLKMGPGNIRLYIEEATTKARGAFEQIKEILVKSERNVILNFHSYTLGVLSLFAGSISIALSIPPPSFSIPLIVYGIMLCALGVFLHWREYSFAKRQNCIIIPVARIESPGFIKRNRDNIPLMLISALVGALLAVAGTLFVGFVTK